MQAYACTHTQTPHARAVERRETRPRPLKRGAIRQTHGAVAKHNARALEYKRTRIRAHPRFLPLSLVLDTGRAGGHGGRAIDRGAGTHKATESDANRTRGHVRLPGQDSQDGVERHNIEDTYKGHTHAPSYHK